MSELTSTQRRRLDELINALHDERLSADDWRELETLLARSPDALWRYVQSAQLEASLRWERGGMSHGPEEADDAKSADVEAARSAVAAPRAVGGFSGGKSTWAALAAALLLATGVVWRLGGVSAERELDQPAVARILSITPDCRWVSDDARLRRGQSLAAGQQIRLISGQVQVGYALGAEVALHGPAAFVVDSANSGELILGGMTVRVPEQARGFRVATPSGEIVDRGTEFGVVVDDFGSAEVGVFRGRVVARTRQDADPVELHAGGSLQWNDGSARFAAADAKRFSRGRALPAFLDAEAYSAALAIADDFSGPQLNSAQWQTLGHVAQEDGGVTLGRGVVNLHNDNVPYLLTKREFDPADGPIVVTGVVQFSDPLDRRSGSLSVFTRAEPQRGAFPRPEYAYLGTGVRSTFWPVSTVAGETLRILVRPLPTADNVGILGEEFAHSEEASRWRFQVIDDGVNLTLAIAQANRPEVTKTVTARSLFRGVKNFVALEGDPNARIVLDDVRIFQLAGDRPSDRVAVDESAPIGRRPGSLRPNSWGLLGAALTR